MGGIVMVVGRDQIQNHNHLCRHAQSSVQTGATMLDIWHTGPIHPTVLATIRPMVAQTIMQPMIITPIASSVLRSWYLVNLPRKVHFIVRQLMNVGFLEGQW